MAGGVALGCALVAASCGGSNADAGGDDASFGVRPDALGEASPYDGRSDRLSFHGGPVLDAVKLRVVYLGEEGVDGPPDVDALTRWLVTSGSQYWGYLQQYGVGAGTLLDSVRIPSARFFRPGMVVDGLVSYAALEARLLELLHPGLVGDGGLGDAADEDAVTDALGGIDADFDADAEPGASPADADADADSSADAEAGAPLLPAAEAYVLMLPNGVNVAIGTSSSHTFQTCIDSGGYHGYDGFEPYAVIPPCREGRSALAVSHEIVEMVTEPQPSRGWFSDSDVKNAGGEIADICNQPVPQGVDGWFVTQLWSNADGRCMP